MALFRFRKHENVSICVVKTAIPGNRKRVGGNAQSKHAPEARFRGGRKRNMALFVSGGTFSQTNHVFV